MRVKLIACLVLMLLLASASTASASLVGLGFPAIRPVYASDRGDSAILSTPVMSIPGPEEFLAALVPPGTSNAMVRDNIYKTLVGKNLTYYSIAGKPMNYTITADSIKGIDSTVYKDELAWRVHVGEGLAWDLTMDASGTKILSIKQLFQT